MNPDKWPPAPMDIECVDIWPPKTLTELERGVYDRFSRAGRIIPRGVKKDATGRVYVRYMADIPHQWIREEMHEAKLAGAQMSMEAEL